MGQGLDSPRAWGVVAAAFAAMFVAFGIAYSYGAFLDEMREDFGVGRAAGAAFFSLTSLLYFGLGGVSGAAGDRFGPRRVLLVGAAALGLGLVVTARAGSLGVALAAYGIGVGIGVACAYVPMVALVGAWFERRRTLALGVAVAGIGIGTLMIPPATAALIEAVGWRDSYLVLAAVGAAALGLCALAAAPAPAAAGAGAASLRDAMRDAPVPPPLPRDRAARHPAVRALRLPALLRRGARRRPGARGRPGRRDRDRERGRPARARRARRAARAAARVPRLLPRDRAELRAVVGGRRRATRCCWRSRSCSASATAATSRSRPAVVAARFGVERLGALLGVLYTSAAIGSAVGPPAAGAVIDAGGYGPAIAASLAIGLAAFARRRARLTVPGRGGDSRAPSRGGGGSAMSAGIDSVLKAAVDGGVVP